MTDTDCIISSGKRLVFVSISMIPALLLYTGVFCYNKPQLQEVRGIWRWRWSLQEGIYQVLEEMFCCKISWADQESILSVL